MYKFKTIPLLLLSTLLLSSCITNVKMIPEEQKSLKTVSLDTNVKLPENMYLLVEGSNLGLIGYALTHNSVAKLQNFDIKHNIDMRKIVLTQWSIQLNQKNISISNSSPYILSTEVEMYGTQPRVPLSSLYGPMVSITGRITHNGKLIWQDNERVVTFSEGMQSYTLAEYFENPKKFESMLNTATKAVVRKLIANMYTQQ
jgi:hypothetical protein